MGSIHKEVIHDESIQKIVSRSTVDTAKVEELLTPPAEVQVVNPTQPAEDLRPYHRLRTAGRGLKWLVAILLFLLIAAIVIGSAVGVTSVKNTKASCDPIFGQKIGQIEKPACPTTPYSARYNTSAKFLPFCDLDFQGQDISGVVAYQFTDCIAACVSYNRFQDRIACVAVSMIFDLQESLVGQGVNCFLKKGIALREDQERNNKSMAAQLCRDSACTKLEFGEGYNSSTNSTRANQT